ncbi:Conserved hypothetical protein; putative exported protein [Herminiimonas arsenicoxydans]|uniref:Uncharacterized protein n=1 Tax=Herminiimonas arsenicoxydans TaxID=204773 RepID=A4G7A3_HERAR|nr:Conserved hypothetical protein; putative exported protein [Herminiimonas arsenicoxydans]
MKLPIKKLIIGTAFLMLTNAFAGPFGLNQGDSADTLAKKGNFKPSEEPYTYIARSLTNGHSGFDLYSVVVTPQQGLCKINALGKDIVTSVYGSELTSAFNRLEQQLSEKYGKAKRYDFLRQGSIWKEPEDWTMSLLKKERTLSSFWGEKNQLADSLMSISLEAKSLSNSKGYLLLSYEFNNFDDCWKVLSKKESANL